MAHRQRAILTLCKLRRRSLVRHFYVFLLRRDLQRAQSGLAYAQAQVKLYEQAAREDEATITRLRFQMQEAASTSASTVEALSGQMQLLSTNLQQLHSRAELYNGEIHVANARRFKAEEALRRAGLPKITIPW